MNRLTDAMDSRSRRILAQDSSTHLRIYHDPAAHRHLILCSICEPNCDWPSSLNRNIRTSDVQVGNVDLSRCRQAAAVWPDDCDLLLPFAPPALAPTLGHFETGRENEHLDARPRDEKRVLDRQQFQLLHVLSQQGSGLKTEWQADLQLKNHSEVRVCREGCLRIGARVVAASSPLPLSSTEPVLPNEERGKFRGRVTQGSSFLTYPGLQSGHPYGVLRLPASAERRRSSDTAPLLQVRRQDYRIPRPGEPPKRDQACSLSCPRSQLHLRPRTGPEGTGKAVPQSPEPILSTCGDGKSPMTEDGQL